jgi:hypothetical protein
MNNRAGQRVPGMARPILESGLGTAFGHRVGGCGRTETKEASEAMVANLAAENKLCQLMQEVHRLEQERSRAESRLARNQEVLLGLIKGPHGDYIPDTVCEKANEALKTNRPGWERTMINTVSPCGMAMDMIERAFPGEYVVEA